MDESTDVEMGGVNANIDDVNQSDLSAGSASLGLRESRLRKLTYLVMFVCASFRKQYILRLVDILTEGHLSEANIDFEAPDFYAVCFHLTIAYFNNIIDRMCRKYRIRVPLQDPEILGLGEDGKLSITMNDPVAFKSYIERFLDTSDSDEVQIMVEYTPE